MDGKKRAVLILLALLYLITNGYGQDCNILSKGNNILPDKLCAPVSVSWSVNYTGVNDGGTGNVEFEFNWDDGNPVQRIPATNTGVGIWEATINHIYPTGGNKCTYNPTVVLVVDGTICTSSDQRQIVTVWDIDSENGGRPLIDPPVFPICVGNDGTVTFTDDSQWNCTPPDELDVPNNRRRWIQWMYGTGGTTIGNAQVAGVVESYPFSGPIEVTTQPILGPVPPMNTAKPIYIPNTYAVGDFFEVTLRNWNYCNPYDDPAIPGPPADIINGDNDPILITAIALIVDIPDGTVNPAGPFCANAAPAKLTPVTPGGRFTGPGITDQWAGTFDPSAAGPGSHVINYEVSDANSCSATGQITIVVHPSPLANISVGSPTLLCPGTILPIDGNPSSGVTPYTHLWKGDTGPLNNTNVQTPQFQTIIEGNYELVYRVTDANSCFDEDTLVVVVDSVGINFANPVISVCSGTPRVLNPNPQGGSGSYVQHLWSGSRTDLLSATDIPNPTFLSPTAGVFKFEYYVRDSHGCDDSDSITVIVYEQPVSNAGADDKACGLRYQLNAIPSVGAGAWSLVSGPGNASIIVPADPQSDVLVDAYGDYLFRWTEDNNGCTDSDDVSIRFVQIPQPTVMNDADTCGLAHLLVATADIGVGGWQQTSGPGSASFTDASATTTPVSVDLAGKYRFAWVEDNDGCMAGDTVTIDFYPAVTADLAPFTNEACNPLSIQFNNTSVNADNYSWDFGDGFISNLKNPEHTFNNPLQIPVSYTVRMQAYSNNGCADSLSRVVTVNPTTIAKFSNDPAPGCSPLLVAFTNQSTGGTSYEWQFGDGSPVSTDEHVSHSFVNNDNFVKSYKVQLKTNNAYGCADSTSTFITVYPNLKYDFTATPTEGCHPLKVQFLATPGAFSYFWEFGDGTQLVASNSISHVYLNETDAAVTYDVNLYTSSVFGCKDTARATITVKPSPKSLFTPDKTEGCSPLPVNFTNNSTGAASSLWVFGDGTSSNLTGAADAQKQYTNNEFSTANYRPKLVVTNSFGCKDSSEHIIRIFPKVEAAISEGESGCSPLRQTIFNSSDGATKFRWDFGDGNTATSYHGLNEWYNTGLSDKSFAVSLIAESSFGCKDTANTTVLVYKTPDVSFTATPKQQQMPASTVTFNNTTPDAAWQYRWEFGNGQTSADQHPSPYTYNQSGVYTIKLVASGEHCADSSLTSVEIIPMLPRIEYGPDTAGCSPLRVQFYNNSVDATTYLWDFGDGNISSSKNPINIFYTPGIYTIKLTAEGPGGITEADHVQVEVYNKPLADFEVRPNRVKLPQPVSLINNSEGAVSYLWDLGDGTTSTEKSLQHIYQQEGVYDIGLTVTNEKGCNDYRLIRSAVTAEAAGKIKFPNAFTPNPSGSNGGQYNPGDPENFVFYPFVQEGIIEYNLKIFTRWGELIYESRDLNIGWDGYYRGKLCTQGVYIWKVVCKYSNGTMETLTGDVTLFR